MKLFQAIFIIFLFGCAGKESKMAESETPVAKDAIQSVESDLPAISEAFVGVDNLRLRAEPGQQGQEIARLPISTMVKPTGRESDFKSTISLRGMPYNEPWFEIEAGQLKGWVFGGALDFSPFTSHSNRQRFYYRINNLSPNLDEDIAEFISTVDEIKDSDGFLKAYMAGQTVKTAFNEALEKKVSLDGVMPKLMWLDTGIKGWRSTMVAEGTRLQMANDYKDWATIASQTPNAADDSYIAFLEAVNGSEHLESHFPNYFLQTWDYGGCSRLGEGIHIKLLKQAEQLYADQTAFSPLIKAQADKIVLDILNPENTYWNPLGPISAELSEILSASWTVISAEDLANLQKRKTAFVDFSKNGIKINEKGI